MRPRLNALAVCLGAALLTVMTGAGATSLTLANSPLIVQAAVNPNIMILMGIASDLYVPAQGIADRAENVYYPETIYESSCPMGSERLPGGSPSALDFADPELFPDWEGTYNHAYFPIFEQIAGQRVFRIKHRYWRLTGVTERILDPSAVCFYDARYHSSETSPQSVWYWIYFNTSLTLSAGAVTIAHPVSGNYANWYLDPTNTIPAWTHDEDYKPGQITRFEVFRQGMRDVITELAVDQASIRLGLAITVRHAGGSTGEQGIDGAMILVGIDDMVNTGTDGAQQLNQAHVDRLVAQIDGVNFMDGFFFTSGYPLLYKPLIDIGKYFLTGTAANATEPLDFTLWPENTAPPPQQQAFSDIFPTRAYPSVLGYPSGTFPRYADDQDVPTSDIITASCQKNFVVMLTSTLPNSGQLQTDQGVDTPLVTYLDSYLNGAAQLDIEPALLNLANVVTGLYDIDLMPQSTMPDKQSLQAYLVGTIDDLPGAIPLSQLEEALTYSGGQVFEMQDLSAMPEAFKSVMFDIYRQVAVGSGGAVASSRVSEEGRVFTSLFDSADWSGDLKAFPLQTETGLTSDESTALWTAAEQLSERDPEQRVIVTHNGQQGAPFRWNRLNGDQRADLSTDYEAFSSVTAEQLGQARLDYLRGDQTNEGTAPYQFRTRSYVLGDIVNSSPVFVGEPVRVPQSARTAMVYVGANDGMLHAFDASDGRELFAYVPRSLSASYLADPDGQGGLYRLTRSEYILPGEHRFYVNLKPTVSEAQLNNQWRTVLVGGLAAGGQGLFALDISNPDDFTTEAGAAAKVLWEIQGVEGASSGLAALGYTFSQPTIAKLNNGQWAVIVGSGYNSTATARLFIIDLADGSLIKEIPVAAGVDSLSTPTVVDLDGDEDADRVYAGDLNGNMWAFDLTGDEPSSWQIAHGNSAAPRPLFTASYQASSGTLTPQPITAPSAVVFHPTQATVDSNEPNLLVLFGTGQYLEENDPSDTSRQAFYAIWDKGVGGMTVESARLVTQSLQTSSVSSGDRTTPIRIFEQEQEVNWSLLDGWRLLFPPGERVISFPIPRGELVHFTTLVPAIAQCEIGGKSWLMAVNMATGASPSDANFDIDGDSEVDEDDLVTADDGTDLTPAGWEFSEAAIWEPHIVNDLNADKTIMVYVTSDSQRGQQTLGDLTSPRRTAWRELQR